jgi:hypothetical protein
VAGTAESSPTVVTIALNIDFAAKVFVSAGMPLLAPMLSD